MKILLIICVGILTVWILYSLRSGSVEQISYAVLEKRNGYEIRRYDEYTVAEVTVEADNQREALYRGFSPLAGYIFGDNTTQVKIAMTAPVMSDEYRSKQISMTAPVLSEQKDSKQYVVQFAMPKEYTVETLPVPNNAQVTLRTIPPRTVAALSYRGYYSARRMKEKGEHVLQLLARDGISALSSPQVAGYNDPFTFPLLIKNEVLVDVRW